MCVCVCVCVCVHACVLACVVICVLLFALGIVVFHVCMYTHVLCVHQYVRMYAHVHRTLGTNKM